MPHSMIKAFLIDGYNLIHALGLIPKNQQARELERARRRMLEFLASIHKGSEIKVTVIFDAAFPPPHRTSEQNYQGIDVVFAVDYDEADTMIEEIIRRYSHPRNLAVVSDDHRIQRAARKRQCRIMGCTAYVDWLNKEKNRRNQELQPEPEKTESPNESERQHWLDEFADLQNDPAMKELFDPWDNFKDISPDN